MPIGFIDRLKSNNPSGYGIVAANEISGHRTVSSLSDLYELAAPILSLSGSNTDNDAIGQLWYVYEEGAYYQLIDWTNRANSNGWQKFQTGGGSGGEVPESLVSDVNALKNWKSQAETSLEDIKTGMASLASKDYVDVAIEDLVGGAPETLDTIKEIAEALKNNPDVVDTLTQIVGNKADKSTVETISTKVTGIDDALNANNTLVTPVITPNWTAYNQSNEEVNLSTILVKNSNTTNPKVENGYKLKYVATYRWTSAEGKRNPTGVSSDSLFDTLTESGVDSEAVNSSNYITTNTTIKAELTAGEVGYKVSEEDYLVPANGTIKTSASASVEFYKKKYYGTTNSANITEAVIKVLSGVEYNNSASLTVNNITTAAGVYYLYAYPTRLSKITANGVTAWDKDAPGTGDGSQAFIESTVTVTNAAGLEITYYAYRTTQSGSLANTGLVFS